MSWVKEPYEESKSRVQKMGKFCKTPWANHGLTVWNNIWLVFLVSSYQNGNPNDAEGFAEG